MRKVYTGYCGTSEIEHGLCACTVDNPLAKVRGLSLRTGAQPMLYLPHVPVQAKILTSLLSRNFEILSHETPMFERVKLKRIISLLEKAGLSVSISRGNLYNSSKSIIRICFH